MQKTFLYIFLLFTIIGNSQKLTPESQQTLDDIVQNHASKVPEGRWFPLENVDGSRSYYNANGILKLHTPYEALGFFNDGLAYFIENGKTGYIDRTGKVIIKPIFKAGNDFEDGRAMVFDTDENHIMNKSGFIDKTGKMIVPFDAFDLLENFSNDLAVVIKDGKNGYIDKQGLVVIPLQFESAGPFSANGLALVRRKKLASEDSNNQGKYGYINKLGEVIIDYKYGHAQSFENGYARVWDNRDLKDLSSGYFIDSKGHSYRRQPDGYMYETDLQGNTYKLDGNGKRL